MSLLKIKINGKANNVAITTPSGTTTVYYYIINLQGDVTALANTSGTLVANYQYDAWGKLISVKNQSGTAITDGNNVGLLNPLRYRGYCYDRETGLYYLQSRYYDPTVGRFINADAIITAESILSTNLFVYCNNNPIMYRDPSGYAYTSQKTITIAYYHVWCGTATKITWQWNGKKVISAKITQQTTKCYWPIKEVQKKGYSIIKTNSYWYITSDFLIISWVSISLDFSIINLWSGTHKVKVGHRIYLYPNGSVSYFRMTTYFA